jgi:DNA repair exonuclease SbcCD ATPase subunit
MNTLMERTPLLIAHEINSIKEQTQRMILVNSIEIGRRLIEAKSLVPHGEWGKWLEESVEYSKSTANNLMNIFEQYGANQLSLFGSEAKSQALGNLSYTQAVALLGIPEDERETFIKENDIDNMSTRELQQAIKEKQEIEKKLKEIEQQAKKEKQAREKLMKEREKLEVQLKEQAALGDHLNDELEKAKAENKKDVIEQLQSKLDDAVKEVGNSLTKIKELERKLKEKPIEAPAVVERVPDEIEKELAELRAKVGQQGVDKSVVKFQVSFESLVNEFKGLLGTLDEIQDAETNQKYKKAVKGLIDKMSERLV